jgi:DNA-binding NarL/FixJ family response regulator
MRLRSNIDPGNIHIVIADDHTIFRQGLRKLLEEQPDLQVVAEFGDGRGICEMVETDQPDLLLLDLTMPEMDGFDVLRQLRVANINVGTIVLTASQDRAELGAALELGAKGIVLKAAATDELLKAIRQVYQGFLWFDGSLRGASPGELGRFAAILDEPPHPGTARRDHWQDLTARELEVAHLVGGGLRYKEIARQLEMSPSTLNNHLRNIFDKLQIRGRVELALLGKRHHS